MSSIASPYPNRFAVSRTYAPSVAGGRASRLQLGWLLFLVLSFCYELPLLHISTFYRANPRLFDVAVIFGVLFILPGILKRRRPMPTLFKVWAALSIWFALCGALWSALWLPWAEAGWYPLFFAGKYFEGLIAIYIAASIPLDARQKRYMQYAVLLGGIVVAVYAIPEYLQGGVKKMLVGEKFLYHQEGALYSCLGVTYFHVGVFSMMSFAMVLSMSVIARRWSMRWILLLLALFVAWPAIFCGSRAGLIGIMLVGALSLFLVPKIRFRLASVIVLGLMLALTASPAGRAKVMEASLSIRRLANLQETGNSIRARFLGKRGESEDSVFRRYRWQSWRLPFFGGGFYAVPYFKNGELYYQRGFGFHNAYFFAFEQGGILAFLLFMAFLIVAFRDLVRMVKHGMPEDRAFALGMLVFMIAFLPILWGGQVFWRGFGTENCNAYIVLLLVLAVTSSNPVATPRQRAQRRTPPFQPPASRALPSTT